MAETKKKIVNPAAKTTPPNKAPAAAAPTAPAAAPTAPEAAPTAPAAAPTAPAAPAETAAQRTERRNRIRNNIPKSSAMAAKRTQNQARAAIPRPPVTAADAVKIAEGQNAAGIRARRKATNKGARERIKHGGKE